LRIEVSSYFSAAIPAALRLCGVHVNVMKRQLQPKIFHVLRLRNMSDR
jgi:hypothetical protein